MVESSYIIDLDQLEEEIAAKEKLRRDRAQNELSGEITGSSIRKSNVQGPIDVGYAVEFDTLDEAIIDSIKRDLKLVRAKFAQVLIPKKENTLRDWDLIGPLFICVTLSLLLQGFDKGPRFTQVFILSFIGSCIVTLNIKLIGGKISFFQAICLIGYCLLPCVFSSVIIKCIAFQRISTITLLVRLATAVIGFLWATYASTAFLTNSQPENRKVLGYYPIILFYFVVSWLVVSNA